LYRRRDNRCCRAPDADERPDPVVVLRSDDGGIDVLAEDGTFGVPPGALRTLLFFGNRIRLIDRGAETDRAVAWPGPSRRWICFSLDDILYRISRSRLVAVVCGEIEAERLYRAVMP
jgi:hypothetical protein